MTLRNPNADESIKEYDELQTEEINNNNDTIVTEIGTIKQSILTILSKLNLISDWVIEYGYNDNGIWEKWASGKLIQKKVHAVARPVATISTSIDYLWTFPIPFVNPSGENTRLPIYSCSFECIQQGTSTRVGIVGTAFGGGLGAKSFTGWAKGDGAFNDYTFRLRAEGYWK